MAGRDLAIQPSRQTSISVEVNPFRIAFLDKIKFPLSRPPFQVRLTLNCVLWSRQLFSVDEHVNPVLRGEYAARALFMFEDTASKVIRDTDVQGAIPFAG